MPIKVLGREQKQRRWFFFEGCPQALERTLENAGMVINTPTMVVMDNTTMPRGETMLIKYHLLVRTLTNAGFQFINTDDYKTAKKRERGGRVHFGFFWPFYSLQVVVLIVPSSAAAVVAGGWGGV